MSFEFSGSSMKKLYFTKSSFNGIFSCFRDFGFETSLFLSVWAIFITVGEIAVDVKVCPKGSLKMLT